MSAVVDFSDAAAVRELAAVSERLVCLEFPEGLGLLYCHTFLLTFSSTVLRNVLEDTQQQGQVCSIPLAGDSDISVWKLALGLFYRLKTATITLHNAQGLLLLADKYNMECITAEVQKFLMSKDIPAADSRLKDSLTPATISTWLPVFSKCGLEQQVQVCIDYIVSQETHVDVDVTSLQPAHANMLLTALQRKLSKANSDNRQAHSRISTAQSQRDKAFKLCGTAGSRGLWINKCSACGKSWIGSATGCCSRSPTSVYLSLDQI